MKNNAKPVMAYNLETCKTITAESIVELGEKLGEYFGNKRAIPESTIRSSMTRNTLIGDFAVVPLHF